jgi:hypothetical protein
MVLLPFLPKTGLALAFHPPNVPTALQYNLHRLLTLHGFLALFCFRAFGCFDYLCELRAAQLLQNSLLICQLRPTFFTENLPSFSLLLVNAGYLLF